MLNCPLSKETHNDQLGHYAKQSCETVQCAWYDADLRQCAIISLIPIIYPKERTWGGEGKRGRGGEGTY